MEKINIGDSDLLVRFILGISLLIYGIAGGMDAPVAFDPSIHHWLIIGIEPVMGTLEAPWNYAVIGAALVMLYTAATRYCLIYPTLRINTYRVIES